MADLTTQQKKGYARTLYLKDNLTQQEIADKVGVSRNTINRWIAAEKWEEMKVGMTPVSYTHLDVYKRQAIDCPKDIPP